MDPVAFLIDLVWGGSKRPQDGFREGQGDFTLAREHTIRPGLVQGRDLTHISRASKDPDARVELPGQPDDLGTGRHAGGAENEAACPVHPGTLQRLTVARIAIYRRPTGLAQAVYSVPVQLDDHRRNPIVPQQARDRLSNRTVADYDGAVAGVEGERPVGCHSVGRGQMLLRTGHEPAPQALLARRPGCGRLNQPVEERIEGDGDDGGGHDGVGSGIREQT